MVGFLVIILDETVFLDACLQNVWRDISATPTRPLRVASIFEPLTSIKGLGCEESNCEGFSEGVITIHRCGVGRPDLLGRQEAERSWRRRGKVIGIQYINLETIHGTVDNTYTDSR